MAASPSLARCLSLLLAWLPLHAEEINLPSADLANGADGWAVSTGGKVMEAPATVGQSLHGGVLALPPGAYANRYLDGAPQAVEIDPRRPALRSLTLRRMEFTARPE
jgi:hypothetical protein